MAKITLARALKIKKILAGKIAKINQEIQTNNSVVVGVEQGDVRKMLATREQLVSSLIDLKIGINESNCDIQRTLYTLSETKAELGFLAPIQTTHGDSGQINYGTSVKIVFNAYMKREEKEQRIAKLESLVEELQERIDQFNYQTLLEVSDGMLALAGVRK